VKKFRLSQRNNSNNNIDNDNYFYNCYYYYTTFLKRRNAVRRLQRHRMDAAAAYRSKLAASDVCSGRLKTRDLASGDRQNCGTDIARLDNAAPHCKGGHR